MYHFTIIDAASPEIEHKSSTSQENAVKTNKTSANNTVTVSGKTGNFLLNQLEKRLLNKNATNRD